MSRTPTTPFIPPMLSAPSSPNPQPSPVIPPLPGNYPPGNYPPYQQHSPYANNSPFIPPSPSGGFPPPPAPPSRQHSRQGVSADYTGYPGGYPPPITPVIPGPPPMHAYTPHPGYSSAPGSYQTFLQAGGTPWNPPGAPLPSPYHPPGGRGPPPGPPMFTPYSPYGAPLPGAAPWGVPPPFGYNPQADWYAQQQQQPGPPAGYGRPPPEPPSHPTDRMDKFAVGPHYGPVLEPMLVEKVKAQVILNPLITPVPEEGPERPYIKWDMLYPTSTAQRSDDAAHVSWYNGRDEPATFPRVTSLTIVSVTLPWMIPVVARDKNAGVTCGEVIEAIGNDMSRLTTAQDFASLSQRDKVEMGNSYKLNRSNHPSVPGGRLGKGMKRLDYLRLHTMFGGLEVDSRVVQRLCGVVLPCVFVLRCTERFRSEQDMQEQEARLRAAAAQHQQQRAPSRNAGARSRANSTNTRITVHPPSSGYDTTDSDSGGMDRR